jgi:hypothetical protein
LQASKALIKLYVIIQPVALSSFYQPGLSFGMVIPVYEEYFGMDNSFVRVVEFV